MAAREQDLRLTANLNTERSYRGQGHATFAALCWLFCAMVESRNNGRGSIHTYINIHKLYLFSNLRVAKIES